MLVGGDRPPASRYVGVRSSWQPFSANGSQTQKVVPFCSCDDTSICPPWLRTIQ
jgi:hypothetical protein